LGAAGAVAAGAAMARPPEGVRPTPQPQTQCRVVNGVRVCEEVVCSVQNGVRVCTKIGRMSEARDTEFWRVWERTQQLQQQREEMLRTIREQAARWQQQYEAHRAAQERAWAEYQRVLAQTGSPQAAMAAYKAVMASAPPPPPSSQPTSFVTGRARERPLPMAIMPEQPQQGRSQTQVPTWAAIGAGAAGLAAVAALLARRPSGLARIASRPVTEAAARRPTITPFFTLLRAEARPRPSVAGRIGVRPQPMSMLSEFFEAARAQRAAMQVSTRAARRVQAAAAARSVTQAATRSARLAKLAKVAKYGAGIGALGLIGYGLFAMATTPETEAQQVAGAAGGAGAGAPRGARAPGVGVSGVGTMGMTLEVGYEADAGVLGGGVGEAGLDYGAVEGAGAVGVGEAGLDYGAVEGAGAVGGFGMPLMPLLILGGVALIILALALSKKK